MMDTLLMKGHLREAIHQIERMEKSENSHLIKLWKEDVQNLIERALEEAQK